MKRLIILIVLSLFSLISSAQLFTEYKDIVFQKHLYGTCAFGDINSDGMLDFVISGSNLNTTDIFFNKGGLQFEKDNSNKIQTVEFGDIDFADFDNDGDLDLVVDGRGGTFGIPYSNLFENDGKGKFSAQTYTNIHSGEFMEFVLGDCDNDGDLDLISTSKLFINNGKFIFNEMATNIQKVESGSVDWGDYDNDGDLDILLTGDNEWPDYSFSKIYINKGNNVFEPDTINKLNNIQLGTVKWSDFDNDGWLDIFFCGYDYRAEKLILKILRNNHLKFEELSDFSTGYFRGDKLTIGDIDNDGYSDLVIIGDQDMRTVLKVFKNNNGISFSEYTNSLLEAGDRGKIVLGDIDNDSDLDILLTGEPDTYYTTQYPNGVSKIYLNNVQRKNTPPEIPINLNAITDSNSVVLSWDRSSDAETPQLGIHYIVDVVRGSDKKIVSSVSYYSDRSISNPSYFLTNLEEGYYYWKVKSIDNSYMTSEFSVIDTFLIGNSPAIIDHSPGNTIISEDQTSFNFEIKNIGNGKLNITSITAIDDWFSVIATKNGDVTNLELSFNKNVNAIRKGRIKIISDNAINSPYILQFEQNGMPLFIKDTIVKTLSPYFGKVTIADYDNDSDYDFLLTSNNSGIKTKLIKNTETGFHVSEITVLQDFSGTARFTDFDNDGDLDILMPGYDVGWEDETATTLYLNSGKGEFEKDTLSNFKYMNNSIIELADFNNDGYDDLINLSTAHWYNEFNLYSNNSGSDFEYDTTITDKKYTGYNILFFDYDGDLDMDLINDGLIYENCGKNNFKPITDLNIDKSGYFSIGDFNNDGLNDIFSNSKIYFNEGHGKYVKSDSTGLPDKIETHSWGDYDNDGDMDIVFKSNSYVHIFDNNGKGQFSVLKKFDEAVQGGSLDFVDYNNDNQLDIVVTGALLNQSVHSIFYKNQCSKTNTIPTPPLILRDSMHIDTVHVSWEKGSDKESIENELYYNFYLYKVNGDTLLNSMSDHQTGHLLKPTLGNTQNSKDWKIKLDSAGIYKWAVQAIDYGFEGSKFSVEKEFEAKPVLKFTPELKNNNLEWQVNKDYLIRWNEAFIDFVKLEYSFDDGANWISIKDSIIANDKSFIWHTPKDSLSEIKIKISNQKYLLSDTITVTLIPHLQITGPANDKKIMINNLLKMKWESNFIDSVKIEYRSINENYWETIEAQIENKDDSYDWLIPDLNTGTYIVRVSDIKHKYVADSIRINVTPYLEVLSPKKHQEVLIGGTTEIKWNYSKVSNISVYYKSSRSRYSFVVASYISADKGFITWSIPPYIAKDSCQIIIKDMNSLVADTSDFFYPVTKITNDTLQAKYDLILNNPKSIACNQVDLTGIVTTKGDSIKNIEFQYATDSIFTGISAIPSEILTDTTALLAGQIKDLRPDTRYTLRIKAMVNNEVIYSNSIQITTPEEYIISLSSPVINGTSVTLGAFIAAIKDTIENIVFEYGTNNEYKEQAKPEKDWIGSDERNSIQAQINNLSSDSIYFYRLKATMDTSTIYSEENLLSIKNKIAIAPLKIEEITDNSLNLKAMICTNGKSLTNIHFLYGTSENGLTDSVKASPFITNFDKTFTVNAIVKNLKLNTKYYFQVHGKSDKELFHSEIFNYTTINSMIVEEYKNENLSPIIIFPNPANDNINISSQTKILYVELFNLYGKKLMEIQNENSLNISGLIPGIYLVRIYTNQQWVLRKIIKK